MDETYVKVKGKWYYQYRAVDKYGHTIECTLSKKRDKAAAKRFFKKAINTAGLPHKITIDKIVINYPMRLEPEKMIIAMVHETALSRSFCG